MKPSKVFLSLPERENGDSSPIVLEFSVWKEEDRLDIRQYWTPEGTATAVPTKKGVNFSFEEGRVLLATLKRMYFVADMARCFEPMNDKALFAAFNEGYTDGAEGEEGPLYWDRFNVFEEAWFDFLMWMSSHTDEYAEAIDKYNLLYVECEKGQPLTDSYVQWSDGKKRDFRMHWSADHNFEVEEI